MNLLHVEDKEYFKLRETMIPQFVFRNQNKKNHYMSILQSITFNSTINSWITGQESDNVLHFQ